jgi:uncharacterized membrane protein YhaH (DUF805 family)
MGGSHPKIVTAKMNVNAVRLAVMKFVKTAVSVKIAALVNAVPNITAKAQSAPTAENAMVVLAALAMLVIAMLFHRLHHRHRPKRLSLVFLLQEIH